MAASRIKFKSLSSGSCGNCYCLSLEDADGSNIPILIDAGVSPRRCKQYLQGEGIDLADVRGLLVTHDHMDHIRSLGSYCKRCSFPVWVTPVLKEALCHHPMTRDWFASKARTLEEGWNEIVPGRIKAKYFIVPHDATQTVGYAILLDGFKFVIMTDIGRMTKEGIDYSTQADVVVIESNYDLQMLRDGPYPVELQDRICLGGGHLSNAECAQAIKKFIHDGLREVFLCHLSEHNNTPKLALEESREAVKGTPVKVVALPRESPSPLFTFDL